MRHRAPFLSSALFMVIAVGSGCQTSGASIKEHARKAVDTAIASPDLDNDQDRILNAKDKCPDQAEKYNGFKDEDGCPDEGQVVIEHIGEYRMPPARIYFERGRADIKPESLHLIEDLAARLKMFRDIDRVLVAGHCSDDEDCANGLDLERADEVVDHMIERGIEPSRLEAAGLGTDKPIVALEGLTGEDLERSRKNNRYVELKITSIPTERRP